MFKDEKVDRTINAESLRNKLIKKYDLTKNLKNY